MSWLVSLQLMAATEVLIVRRLSSILLSRVSNSTSEVGPIMDAHVTQASKKMSVEDFSHLLDVLEEGIGGSGLRGGHRERLIHLGQVLLHDAPQGRLDPTNRVPILQTNVHRYAKGRSELCNAMFQSVHRPRGDLWRFLTSKNPIPRFYCEVLFRSGAHSLESFWTNLVTFNHSQRPFAP